MTAAQLFLFLAVLVQVAMTLSLYVRLLSARILVAKGGHVDLQTAAYDGSAWPEKPRIIANAVSSQFELPVLFYVAVALAFPLGAVNWITVILAWAFVISRFVHAMIHTGSNSIMPRLRAFLAGFVIIVLLWAYLTFRVVTGALIFS